jgi:hypothetical protein
MLTITLLAKAYDEARLKQVDGLLKSKLQGLKTAVQINGTTARGWIRATLSGEDERAALHYLADEIGLCPTSLEHIDKFSAFEGRITGLNKSKDELPLDVGIFEPEIVDVEVPLSRLQAQLGDGRRIALGKLIELYGFCDNLPLAVKVSDLDKDKSRIEAMLSEKQLSTYRNWTESLLDRLIVLGASQQEVRSALERARSERDVVDVEPLGLFEFAVVCKLGTDAAGLIPRIGRSLRNAAFTVFNPRRIRGFFEESTITQKG